MRKSEYIKANAQYMGDTTNIEQIPESCWDAVVEAAELHTGADKGSGEPGISCEIVITHETLADFDSSRLTHWRERGERSAHAIGGLSAMRYEGFQRSKGQSRESMTVVDCGDLRVVLI